MWRYANRRAERGFMLLEAMLAVVILAVGIAALLRTFSGSVRAVQRIEDRLQARLLLEERVHTLLRQGLSSAGQSQGEFPEAPDYSWTVQTVPYADIPGLFQAKVTVHWKRRGHSRRLETALLVRGQPQPEYGKR